MLEQLKVREYENARCVRREMADIPIFNAPPEYYELWKYSIENPEGFWSEMAEKSMKSKSNLQTHQIWRLKFLKR